MSDYREIAFEDWSLDKVLEWRSRLTPEAPFLSFLDGPALSFAEVSDKAAARAEQLDAAGVRQGTVVALLLPNSIEHVILWFAINLLGAADAPVNPAFVGAPLEHAFNLVEAEIAIVEGSLVERVISSAPHLKHLRKVLYVGGEPQLSSGMALRTQRLHPTQLANGTYRSTALKPSDLTSILFTSGTTGPSKGVMVTQAQAFLTARQTAEGLAVSGEDVYYCSHPLFHMSPRFCAVYTALLTGAKVSLDTRFSAADWLERVRRCGATVTIGHGPLLEMIHAQPESSDDSDNPLTRLGTSPFPKHIAADFERRFGLKGVETWGMTEINIPCWHPMDEPLRPGSCGRLREEWYELQVVDPDTDQPLPAGQVGEFVIRPKLPWIVSPGYYKNPDATLRAWRNLWFHTGDSGYLDEEGWAFFVDRLGDRIRRRAENISSYDIELVANGLSEVLESAAVGVPSGFVSDDDIKLCVVLHKGADFDPASLLTRMAAKLPHHMVPRYVERLDAMPRTPTQKIRKSVLRQTGVSAATWDRKANGFDLMAVKQGHA